MTPANQSNHTDMRKLILALALVLATLGASAFVTDTISVPAKNL